MARPAARYCWCLALVLPACACRRSTTKYLVVGRAHRPKITRKGAFIPNLIYPLRNAACWRCLGIDGCVVQETAVLLLDFAVKKVVSGWGNEPFCLWACRLAKAICSGSYFEFLMRRVAVVDLFRGLRRRFPASAVRSALHRPCSRACRRSYLLACRCSCSPAWRSSVRCLCRSRASRRAVLSRPVASSRRGVVSAGFVTSGEVALSAAAFASSYALQASS